MNKRDELLRTKEFWLETLQNEIYRMVAGYIDKEGINQTQLAEKLGVTKGYVSQILNGNFNYTLKKMIELSLALNKVPVFEFTNLEQFIQNDCQNRYEMEYNPFSNIAATSENTNVSSGKTVNSMNIKSTIATIALDAA